MTRPPYLPFLDGPPEFAPGLMPIDEAAWLTPDTEAEAWLADKNKLMRDRRNAVFANTGERGSLEEAAGLIARHLGRRAPGGWPSALEAAASLVSDDLCVMIRGEEEWCLEAASLCAPTFWSLSDYIGKPLAGLHRSVNGREASLSTRITRIFDMMRDDQIFERFNWTVQIGPERFTPMRPVAENPAPDDLFFRVERQTIRKLPRTGAVLFTIRICIDPLMAVIADNPSKAAFAHAWRGASDPVRAYKGWAALDESVEALLVDA